MSEKFKLYKNIENFIENNCLYKKNEQFIITFCNEKEGSEALLWSKTIPTIFNVL